MLGSLPSRVYLISAPSVDVERETSIGVLKLTESVIGFWKSFVGSGGLERIKDKFDVFSDTVSKKLENLKETFDDIWDIEIEDKWDARTIAQKKLGREIVELVTRTPRPTEPHRKFDERMKEFKLIEKEGRKNE